jgi:DNA integrity scanning protein DisA with diadenylate cyclase activity
VTLSTVWSHISVISIIDVSLLVAFLIYQLLTLVRGTRAAPMLVGVATLGLAFYFAHLGELRTLNWLLSTLLPYVVFALIVVFQSEIRHALANLGSRISLMRSSSSVADVYDDIVLAANLFSQNQTGALIVIEREIGLRTYIESGVALDARLSYDLLATVFRPSAPLARWRRDCAARPHRGRGLLSAVVDESSALDPTGNASSGGDWDHGRNRRGRGDRFRRDGHDQRRGGGEH